MFAKVLNYLFLVLLLIIAKAPTSWGFSISRTASYLENAKKQNLAHDPKWLRLGHYEKTLFGYSSTFRGPLYINPEGYTSPEKELISSIEAMFSDSPELTKTMTRHPQCQFLARRNWLIQKLDIHQDDILPCEERVRWKKQLSATSASLIFASSDFGNPASSFGHTFIKLVNPANAKNKDLIDYGVNYAADADQSEGLFYAIKGLFGMYGGRFTMLPYHQKIREYINLEGRDIWEYPLDLSEVEVDELINHLLEMDNSVSPYYFFSDNCSYQILSAFDVIRPNLDLRKKLTYWVIPIDTVKIVDRHTNLIKSKKYKKSLKTDYIESYAKLGILQKKALDEAIVKLKISDDYELTNKEKAEVYETATKYLAVKAYRTQTDLDEDKYKLSTERSALGQITQDAAAKQLVSPDESHDSSALYFGFGQTSISDYSSFKFRSAYHDLEQTDGGAVPFSQNTIAAFEVRHYSEIKKTSIERFTFLNLINTNPVTPLEKNISWKIRLDMMDQWRPDTEAGGGMSFDISLGNSRIAYYLTARYFKGLDHTYQAGPEILFVSKPFNNFGFSLDLTYFAQDKQIPYLRFNSKFNYQIYRNLDLQLQANDLRDYQFNFVKNFIF
ncbi:DUF4105 domain-containing protein [bacterium]|nr:DUF4105 domain-containing protein [bacterium]